MNERLAGIGVPLDDRETGEDFFLFLSTYFWYKIGAFFFYYFYK